MNIADAKLVLRKLENYDALDKRGREPDPVGWIALHYFVGHRFASTKRSECSPASAVSSPSQGMPARCAVEGFFAEHAEPNADATIARLRWSLGVIAGLALGILIRGGNTGAYAHPWATMALCAIGGGLLALGVGRAETLKEAKALLLECAKDYCLRRIKEAQQKAAHYKGQLAALEKKGLVKSATGLPDGDGGEG